MIREGVMEEGVRRRWCYGDKGVTEDGEVRWVRAVQGVRGIRSVRG